MMKFKPLLQDLSDYFLSLFFPNRCIFCNEIIGPFDYVCHSCSKNLPYISGEICLFCGCEKSDCVCKKRHSNFYDGVAAPFYYSDSVKTAIHNFKFHDERNNYKTLAKFMNDTRKNIYKDIEFDYITYIPMSKKKERKRGYNQSKLLAHRISELSSIEFADNMILQIYPTNTQHKFKSWTERRGNLIGVYEINPKYDVKNKTILIVDDVKTSGATLSESGKMFYLSDVKSVYCLTAALVNSKM